MLRDDIATRGVLVPVEVDEHGHILDGHHRVSICEDLGIRNYPRVVRSGLTETDKIAHAVALNLSRRHLTPDARAKAVAALRAQGWSTRRISSQTGISQSTVVRDLHSRDPGGSPQAVIGSDGKTYSPRRPRPIPSVYASTAREQQRAQTALTALGNTAPAKVLDLRRAERLTRDARSAARRAGPPVTLPPSVRIEHNDFRHLDVEPGTVDLVLTDPPYTSRAVRDGLWDDLGDFAARVLRPGGYLAAISGQMYLPQILAALGAHLDYHWTVAICHDTGTGTAYIRPRQVLNAWKPVVIFRARTEDHTDPAPASSPLADVVSGPGRAKTHAHPWEQPVAEAEHLIAALSNPDDIVVDPFIGSGTTAVAAVRLGRDYVGCDINAAHVATSRQRVVDTLAT